MSKEKARARQTLKKQTAPSRVPESSNSDFLAIRQEFIHLSARVDRQDIRIDSLEGTLASQHNEVMNMLRVLSVGNTSSASSKAPPPSKVKRGPQMNASPLKAETVPDKPKKDGWRFKSIGIGFSRS